MHIQAIILHSVFYFVTLVFLLQYEMFVQFLLISNQVFLQIEILPYDAAVTNLTSLIY